MTVLVGGFAHVCVEAVITDAHREVASAGLPFLNLVDAAALGQLASRGASGDALREGRPVRPRDGFDGMEIEPKLLAVSLSALVKLMQPEG